MKTNTSSTQGKRGVINISLFSYLFLLFYIQSSALEIKWYSPQTPVQSMLSPPIHIISYIHFHPFIPSFNTPHPHAFTLPPPLAAVLGNSFSHHATFSPISSSSKIIGNRPFLSTHKLKFLLSSHVTILASSLNSFIQSAFAYSLTYSAPTNCNNVAATTPAASAI